MIPDEVQVLFSTADRRFVDEPLKMRSTDDKNRFTVLMVGEGDRGIRQNLQYRVVAGDATSETYAITVDQPPTAHVTEVTYQYPAYMNLPERVDSSGTIEAWEGTTVSIAAESSVPVETAILQMSDDAAFTIRGEELPMTIRDQSLSLQFKLAAREDGTLPRFYRIQVTDAEGNYDLEPVVYALEIRKDLPPVVRLLDPTRDLQVAANAIVPLLVEAEDPDFLLRSVTLHYSVNGTPIQPSEVLLDPSKSAMPKRWAESWDFRLSALKLNPGDLVTYHLEARDNRPPLGNMSRTGELNLQIKAPISDDAVQEQLAQDREMHQQQLKDRKNGDPTRDASSQQPSDDAADPLADPDAAEPTEPDAEPAGETGSEENRQAKENGSDRSGKPNTADPHSSGDTQKTEGESATEPRPEDQPTKQQSGKRRADDDEALQRLIEEMNRKRDQNGTDTDSSPSESTPGNREGKQRDASKPGEQAATDRTKSAKSDADPVGKERTPGSEPKSDDKADNSKTRQDADPPMSEDASSDSADSPSNRQKGEEAKQTGNEPEATKPETSPKASPSPGDDQTIEKRPGESPKTADTDSQKPEKMTEPGSEGIRGEEKNADKKSGDSESAGNGLKPQPNESKAGESPEKSSSGEQSKPAEKPAGQSQEKPSDSTQPDTKNPDTGMPQKTAEPNTPEKNGAEPPEKSDNASPKPNAEQSPKTEQPERGQEGSNDNKQSDPPNSDEMKQDESKAGESKSGESKSGESKSGESKSGESKSGESKSGESKSGESKSGESKSGESKSGESKSGESKSGESKSGESKSGESKSGDSKSGDSKSGDSKSGDSKSGESKSGESKSGESKSGESKSGEGKGGEGKGGEGKGGEGKGGEGKGSKGKGGDAKSGGKPGKGNAGKGRSSNGPAGGQGEQGDAEMQGGGVPGGGDAPPIENSSSDPSVEEAAQAADLALRRLQKDLDRGDVDPKLLEDLGWTKDELTAFKQRLGKQLEERQLNDQQQKEKSLSQKSFEEMLRSLDVNSTGTIREGLKDKDRDVQDTTGRQSVVPRQYQEQYKRYQRSVSGLKDKDASK
jgi:hypothetical protein